MAEDRVPCPLCGGAGCFDCDEDGMVRGPDEVECGPLLAARLRWETENPRPESLRRAEKMLVQALVASGFGRQYQVTRADGFEIAVDDLLIRVELLPADVIA